VVERAQRQPVRLDVGAADVDPRAPHGRIARASGCNPRDFV
jgi:hypothetical protein